MVAFPGQTRIENVEAGQMRNERQIQALHNKVIQVDDRIDRTLNAVIATHDKYLEFTTRFDNIDQRFNHVDGRFDQVDERFNQIDARFNQVDMRLNALENRMDRRFDRMDQRMDRMDQRMDRMEHVMVAVAGKLGVSVPA